MDDALKETLSEKLPFHWSHLIADEVKLHPVEKLEGLGHVVALLNMCIAIHLVTVGLGDNVELIVETVMADIVTKSSHKK